jgi:hypothetical protein
VQVPHTFCRFLVSLVLSPSLALSGALAPEHVHESAGDHPRAIAHRHVQPHEFAAHDHDGAELDHGDGHIVWLDDVGAYRPTYQLPIPNATLSDRFELAPPIVEWIATPVNDAAPPHGPPRLPQSLRAPPIPAL